MERYPNVVENLFISTLRLYHSTKLIKNARKTKKSKATNKLKCRHLLLCTGVGLVLNFQALFSLHIPPLLFQLIEEDSTMTNDQKAEKGACLNGAAGPVVGC